MNMLQFSIFEKIPTIIQEFKLLQQQENSKIQIEEDMILAQILNDNIEEVRKKVITLTTQFKVIIALGIAIDALIQIEKIKEKTLKLHNLFKGLPQEIDNLALKLFTDKEKCLIASFLYLCSFIQTHKSISKFIQEVQEFADKTIENQVAYIADSIVTQLKKANLLNKYTQILSEKLTIDCVILNESFVSQKKNQQYSFIPFQTKGKAVLKLTVKKSQKTLDAKSKSFKKGKSVNQKEQKLAKNQLKQQLEANSEDSETENVIDEKLSHKKKESVFEDLQKFKQQQAIVLGGYQTNSKKRKSTKATKQDLFNCEFIDKLSLNHLQAYINNRIPQINIMDQEKELKNLLFDI